MNPRDDYDISDDPARLDVDAIHAFLSTSYWAPGIPKDVIERAIRGSLCWGLYYKGEQIGFARVVTDRATFAYLTDVVIADGERGQGLGMRLMEHIVTHPDLQGLRRFALLTADAMELYEKLGFRRGAGSLTYMERAG